MIDILGKEYMSDKEAARRYGYSQGWFLHGRAKNFGPPYHQIGGKKSRVWYCVEECDAWFKKRLEEKE